jgi:hypothetical protein
MTAVAHPARSAPREQRIGPVFAALMLVMLIARFTVRQVQQRQIPVQGAVAAESIIRS